jgi:hypothetical protein
VTPYFVGMTVQFRPRVTGGLVIATVTAVHDIPLYGVSLDIVVTDGTRVWPTGLRECIDASMLSS